MVLNPGTSAQSLLPVQGRGPTSPVAVRTPNGELHDLSWAPLQKTTVEPVQLGSPDGLAIMRHSAAHVLAQAVGELYDYQLGNGPAIEDGFFYDFNAVQPFKADDLQLIQSRMRDIIKAGQQFRCREIDIDNAREELHQQALKLELLDRREAQLTGGAELPPLTMYDNVDRHTGEVVWTDLCRGPHLPTTAFVPAVELTHTSSAYWLGDETKPQVQRIYGTAWATREDLKRHQVLLAERAKRDHRRLGEDLDLFAFSDNVGQGLPLWLPNGTVIRDELEHWARTAERPLGYQPVVTPHLTKGELYYLSGHLPYYADDMYAPIIIDDTAYYLKPMNCPHHHEVFAARPHSYRDLPYRIAEYGTVYRFEQTGQLHGLMRVRGFTQNDAHIYCRPEDAEEEFLAVMRLHDYYYRALGITDFRMVHATRDPHNTKKYHDDNEMWERAQAITRSAMERSGIPFSEDVGGAAHYGPKVDFVIRSVTGKEFAASTNQVDLYTPRRFGLTFKDRDGADKPVVVIHRAPLGSHERFVAFLIEHFAGAFPVWLAPEQVRVIPLMPEHGDYAELVKKRLLEDDVFRVAVDHSDSRMAAKVRTAITKKIPLIVVVGGTEAQDHSVTVRTRDGVEETMPLEQFSGHVAQLIHAKALDGAGHIVPPS